MKSLLCDLILSCALVSPQATPVEDLYYGTVLYAYYQEDYESALLETLVAEQLQREGDDPVRFELAKGSFAFADGMYGYAEETFDSIDDSELSELDRMRLSFHLAREYFRREDWPKVAQELSEIDLGKTWLGRQKRYPEIEFMRAELATHQGNYDLARQSIEHLKPEDPYRAYALYNLGVALKTAGQFDPASAVFSELAGMQAYDAEALDLIQRSKLALAFLKRQLTETATAESILGGLPAAGRYQDIAMAAYGGLAMDNGDYRLAARIWMSLQNQDYWTPSTAKARLAFPMSLEQLSSPEMALVKYRSAEKSFENRLTTLTRLTSNAEDPQWVHDLLKVFSEPRENPEELAGAIESWRSELGHTDWLEWLSTETVHGLLLDWRKLGSMKEWLDQLPDQLDAFQQLSTEQRRRAAEARRVISEDHIMEKQQALVAAIAALQKQLRDIASLQPERSSEWMNLIANQEQAREVSKFQRMRMLVKTGMQGAQQQRFLKRLDRAEGLLFWQLVQDAPKRIRSLEKELKEFEGLSEELSVQLAQVNAAESNFVAGVETNFLAFQDRADDISHSVDQALAQREATLAAEIRAGIQREKQQVKKYLLVTRIAIARATDMLAMDQTAEGGEE